ncbi:toll/interleukin-1 receptor domain-containing protein [Curtobacterium flaccumfaciens]|uniref:toll/interleukin-1 receptor domain-containing protein n=1 Tax=Curtobacterium flaccumfaciens TaxID=2035 RepID=UPI00112E9614|nr:toll/interleukin-1 receptor domain-containing protein [Curtobacterium flaccumfaciens]TPG09398.1 toll/interleukin-1 receptor domain-containing protein [Curtobacterium flaccumfaciens]
MADVFISWSGDTSKYVAGVLYEHLPKVIQGLKVFFSDQDIPSGTTWLSEIQGHLDEAKYGIVCVTPDNTEAPWLFFEAGAISRQTGTPASRVSPLAINMSKETLPSPLQGYNAVDLDETGFVKLVKSIHETLKVSAPWTTIEEAAHHQWSLMEPQFRTMPTSVAPAPTFDLQEAIIEMRGMLRDLAKPRSPRRNWDAHAVQKAIADWSTDQGAGSSARPSTITWSELQHIINRQGYDTNETTVTFPDMDDGTPRRIPPEDGPLNA